MHVMTQSEVAFITLHSQHAVMPILLFSPAARIKMITLRSESVKLLTQKMYCQPNPSLFQQVYLCCEWPTSDSVFKSGPTQSESPIWQMTPCFKRKWLQRENKTNSLGSIVTFKTVHIHPSLWIFTHFFFSNKYAFPHLSLCHAGSHSSFFEHMVLLLPTLSLELHLEMMHKYILFFSARKVTLLDSLPY